MRIHYPDHQAKAVHDIQDLARLTVETSGTSMPPAMASTRLAPIAPYAEDCTGRPGTGWAGGVLGVGTAGVGRASSDAVRPVPWSVTEPRNRSGLPCRDAAEAPRGERDTTRLRATRRRLSLITNNRTTR